MTDEEKDEIPDVLNKLDADELKRLQDSLTNMINHMATRIQYAETRRNTFAVVGGTFAAGGIAIITLAISQVTYLPAAAGLISFGSAAILTGIITWIVYARQTNFAYPFLKSDSRFKSKKWFYHEALPDKKVFDSTVFGGLTSELLKKGKKGFEEQWELFCDDKATLFGDPKANAYDDLKQIYLLHVNERYKNLFLTHLRKIIFWGLMVSLLFAGLGTVVSVCLTKAEGIYSKTVNVDTVAITSTWQSTKRLRSDSRNPFQTEVLFNATVQNTSDQQFVLSKLIARHKNGMQIPVIVETLNPHPITISPGATVDVDGVLWVPSSQVNGIDYFELTK